MQTSTLALLVFLAAACAPAAETAPPRTGALLFARSGCSTCHGSGGEGTTLGPALGGLGEHWTREELAAYILAPAASLESKPHLAAMVDQFSAQMPPSPLLDDAERLDLATYLLGLPDTD